ncbi:TfoX/Sxy family protein [Candidatus Synchoanobacter obligatus]|uniref:TfoX/Sxy family protein n=1 Tax=Candidatus Synchoanobacter obligatus TaxID=2919597 RepID=A0ABT1L4F0_9GAMM|nr:TfoX/Sxy family protein [Candidatus Synchoanobacter obligatus]MCP8351831.1 TfoX/Sxy family protein [Candidatus Synchoanobacter obligatus]
MDRQETISQLKKIKNIGPAMAKKLYDAEIYRLEDLIELGAEEAYIKIDESGGFCGIHHPAYLYALEGAIIDCAWKDLPQERKHELKAFAARL